MKPLLKTATIKVGEHDVAIRELSVKASAELAALQRSDDDEDKAQIPALVCKYGVVEWADATVDEIEEGVGVLDLNLLVTEIYKLSGIEMVETDEAVTNGEDKTAKKDSATTQSESSSTV